MFVGIRGKELLIKTSALLEDSKDISELSASLKLIHLQDSMHNLRRRFSGTEVLSSSGSWKTWPIKIAHYKDKALETTGYIQRCKRFSETFEAETKCKIVGSSILFKELSTKWARSHSQGHCEDFQQAGKVKIELSSLQDSVFEVFWSCQPGVCVEEIWCLRFCIQICTHKIHMKGYLKKQ